MGSDATDDGAVMTALFQQEWNNVAFTSFIAVVTASIMFIVMRLRRTPAEPTVTELNIYPIKSCGPMKVQLAMVTDIGFSYDRFAQVSDSAGNYLTPRDKRNVKLFHVKPRIIESNDGSNIHLDLTFNDGKIKSSYKIENLNEAIENKSATKDVTPMIGPKVKCVDVGDGVSSWLSNVTGIADCRLTAIGPQYLRYVEENPDQGEPVPFIEETSVKNKEDEGGSRKPVVSLADEAPFLLTSSSSLQDLNARLKARGKAPVDMQRFRPNIVVSGRNLMPWEEDTWKRIRIGGIEFHVWQRCGRCSMTTIDRDTLERGPEPLATLSTFRERANGMRNFGMHMVPVWNSSMEHAETSTVQVRDKIEVLEYCEERLKEWKRLFSPSSSDEAKE